jgi:nucleotide-binding universal stress UspA family protein
VTGKVLFCYDGSDGSKRALHASAPLLAQPTEGYVLTVWQSAAVLLEFASAFSAPLLNDEPAIDEGEERHARFAAEEGVRLAAVNGSHLTALVERADQTILHQILSVADRYDVSLIVCGQRGRGAVRSALLGSVSHGLASHATRPVLIAPEHPAEPPAGDTA